MTAATIGDVLALDDFTALPQREPIDGRVVARTGTRWFSTTALWLLGAFLATAVAGLLVARDNGLRLDLVATGSMEPAVPTGSLVAMAPIAPEDLAVGDVVFYPRPDDRRLIVMHRIIELLPAQWAKGEQVQAAMIRTKGDANDAPDLLPVPQEDVLGVLRWHLPGVKQVVDLAAPPVGTIVLAVVPLALAGLHHASRRPRPSEVGDG